MVVPASRPSFKAMLLNEQIHDLTTHLLPLMQRQVKLKHCGTEVNVLVFPAMLTLYYHDFFSRLRVWLTNDWKVPR
jgi:hypothetical protein